jgi:predicted metal-dependent hydrolase
MPAQTTWMTIEGIAIEVRYKRMKTIRIHIVPPDGRVWMSAPVGTSRSTLERVVTANLTFIQRKQTEIRSQVRSAPAQPMQRGWHRLLGIDYPLVVDGTVAPGGNAWIDDGCIRIPSRLAASPEQLQLALDRLQGEVLHRELKRLMPVWEARLGRCATWWGIRRMRTRWGSCSPGSGRIRFSLNLGSQHPRQIEYLVLHELAHLFVPNHGPDFVALMNHHMPDWRERRSALTERE